MNFSSPVGLLLVAVIATPVVVGLNDPSIRYSLKNCNKYYAENHNAKLNKSFMDECHARHVNRPMMSVTINESNT